MIKNSIGQLSLDLDKGLRKISADNATVTEENFKFVLSDYNLTEGLTMFANLSLNIFNQDIKSPYTRINISMIKHSSGIFLTQFAIEYLVNILIISGANDYKNKSLGVKDNFLGLFNIYHYSIVNINPTGKASIATLIMLSFQQFRSQRPLKEMLARQLILFGQINKDIKGKHFCDLDKDIHEATGLNIMDIIGLSFGVFSVSTKNPLLKLEYFINARIPGWEDLLVPNKIISFFNLYSCTYSRFRELDKLYNERNSEEQTKARFNPLWKKPIIDLGKDTFLIPSISAYGTALFYGLFWWFDDYYKNQSKSKQMSFRSYFGLLFETYVGKILTDIYGKEAVSPQIRYGKRGYEIDFVDWTVQIKEKVYLFEAKAYQFSLETLQSGSSEIIEKEILNKVVSAIKQIYQRVSDVSNYPDLSYLRSKSIIPIIVFNDLPLISSSVYYSTISIALNNLESDFKGIKDFKYYLIGIEDLEDFYYCSEEVEIEKLLKIAQEDNSTSFDVEVKKNIKDRNRKNYLDRVFDDYTTSMIQES